MITNLASLLAELLKTGVESIAEQDITHAPTIGAMYEGLTRDLLDRSIPRNADLRVVQGFIKSSDGTISTQIDCMLVTGEGSQLPFTDSYVWDVVDVIAILEVKKNLYARELGESFEKQAAVHRMFTAEMGTRLDRRVDLSSTFRGFAQLTGRHLNSYQAANDLPDLEKIIFHLMVTELVAPARIIMGYEGYADEHSLRDGLVDYLETQMSPSGRSGFGAFSIPNLIIARNNSIIKLNGYPYIAPLAGGWWHVLASNSENPFRILLESIWTKIENRFGIAIPEDTNLQKERMAPLLRGKVRALGDDKWGWIYEAVEIARPVLTELQAEGWTPDVVDSNEWTLLAIAMDQGFIDIDDPELKEFAQNNGTSVESLVEGLVVRRLVAWEGERKLRPIHEHLISVWTPDGKVQVSANANMTGEWLAQKVEFVAQPLGEGELSSRSGSKE